ncbi:UNVERIFIED_CONTAM: Signal recognition particle subunit SRP72 [Sesamum angustifolium]|uniref:Signal recognition particle subunit SRP72 n=1 Tax=Sesamum angustifolium TaxID=2727405 RepID=A0AAW2QTX5_9LAMI
MAPKAREKAKPAATAAAPAVAIEDLFTSLNRHIQRSEYDLAVKVSDQVLSIAPGDEDAIRCKLVALIKNDSIDDALSSIQEFSKKTSMDFSFFKAYCLYRQNKLDEALESLKGQEGDSAIMLLESQILFRLGKMDACVDIYQKLQKSKIDSLEINFAAGLVSAGRASEVQGTMDTLRVKPTSSFELAYNVACSLIERNKYKDAEQMLLSARRIGQETLMEENLADDDIEIELAPLAVQLAYVQQPAMVSAGPRNSQEAFESYSSIIKKNLADESSLAGKISNLIAIKGPKDVSDGLRKLDKLIEKGEGPLTFHLARGLDLKLSQKQREAIYVNRMLLLLHSNKLDQARELASALPGMFPNSIMPVLLQAAVSYMEEGRIAARLYEELVKTHGSIGSFGLVLIQTAAHTDIQKAESYEKQLKPFPGLKGMLMWSLEKTSGAKNTENAPAAGIPEAYEPKSPPPDPERWLPKRERSSYRPKRKDKRAAQIRGSQGAVVKEAASNVSSKSNQTANSKGTYQASTEQPKPSSKSRKKSRN